MALKSEVAAWCDEVLTEIVFFCLLNINLSVL